MLFPDLRDKVFGYLNMNVEAQKWCAENRIDCGNKNPLLDPIFCERVKNLIHLKYDLDCSYGGWMEDRSFIWKGSYLEERRNFVHLGVDFYVPAGTEVAVDFDAEVVRVDDDYPDEGGWGPRVIVRHLYKPIYMLYAHLGRNIHFVRSSKLESGMIFAQVGAPPFNGNWSPHLHIQTISSEYYRELELNNSWNDLDGYGRVEDFEKNVRRFRDPMQYVSLV